MSTGAIIKFAATVSVLALPLGAQAQTFFDTINGLKNTVKQLSRTGREGAQAEASGSPTRAATDSLPMVPELALTEDRSDTQLETAAFAKSKVQSFDIMGFRLGMSPREVSRLAAKRGIHAGSAPAQLSGSFEVEATALANVQLNNPITKKSRSYLSTAFGKSDRGEEFIFHFTLEPNGPKLSRLNYEARLNGQAPEQLKAALIAKYGSLTNSYQWCSDGCPGLGTPLGPYMTMNIFGSTLTLNLYAGKRYEENARRVLEARAQQIAAKRGDGVRF